MMIDVAEWRPDVLLEHAEELEALWNRRLLAERSAMADKLALARLDRRIGAHADALLLAGWHADDFLEPFFAAEEAPAAAALAFMVALTDAPAMVKRFMEVLPAMPP